MAIDKPKDRTHYRTRFTIKYAGKSYPVSENTGETTREGALRFEAKLRTEIREQLIYGAKPKKTWLEAKNQWLTEMQHKKSICSDIFKFDFLDKYFDNLTLDQLTRERIEELSLVLQNEGLKPATINRYLSLIKAILNKAYKQWEWIDRVPFIRMRIEDNARERALTQDEANRLLLELQSKEGTYHLYLITLFALATGQRKSNILNLRWSDIQGNLWVIKARDIKNKKAHGVPLNKTALEVLEKCKGNSPYVFMYKGKRIQECNTRAWRKAVKKVGIEDFRFHDVRHTWASWHLQSGTPEHTLQKLGNWLSRSMVDRYGHLTNENLLEAANKIVDKIND